jgi:hypothetical protein
MKIESYKIFKGQHCETNTIGNLFLNIDVDLSEPMIFGLASGLGYILEYENNGFPLYWRQDKT